MVRKAPRFLLRCDALNSRFTLAEAGEDWEKEFDSFDDACEQAKARATIESALSILNELGQMVWEMSVSPLQTTGATARERWRKTLPSVIEKAGSR